MNRKRFTLSGDSFIEPLKPFCRFFLPASLLFFFVFLLIVSGCVKTPGREKAPHSPTLLIAPFPEADTLFQKDPRWLGGDGASSIAIGHEEILWLFGDTFIGTDGLKDRKKSVMIRNSIAIQKGSDPTKAGIHFYFRDSKGKPAPYFQLPHLGEVWPSMGILVRDKLFVFLMSVVTVKNDLGFHIGAWHCVSVMDRSPAPEAWAWRQVPPPASPSGLPLTLTFVFSEKRYVYGFLTHKTSHDIYLCRWPIEDFFNERLLNPSWWRPSEKRWTTMKKLKKGAAILPIFRDGQMEFSIEWQPLLKQYMLVQSQGFGNAPIGIRRANKITGPWSPFTPLFSPPFSHWKNIVTYAAKSHPEQTGAPLIFTYAVNSLDFNELLSDNRIYFPYFLKGTILHAP